MASPDVDVHAKTWNHREKRKKNNLLKIKRILNTETEAEWGPVSTFSLPREAVRTHALVS